MLPRAGCEIDPPAISHIPPMGLVLSDKHMPLGRYRWAKNRSNDSIDVNPSRVFDFGLVIYFLVFDRMWRIRDFRSLYVPIRTTPTVGRRLSNDAIMRSLFIAFSLYSDARKVYFEYVSEKKERAIIYITVISTPLTIWPLFI